MTNPFNQQAPIPGIKNIIAVGSGKGGVGKSSIALNLAVSLKKQGHKVGLLDADIYGPSLPRMTGALNQKITLNSDSKLEPIVKYGLKIMSMGFLVEEGQAIIWRGPMLFKAMNQFFQDVQWGELDYLIIDLPPGTGDVCLTIAQKVPVTGALVVSTPQNIALVDAKKAIDMFVKLNIPVLGVVENMSGFNVPGTGERIELFPKGQLDTFLESNNIAKLTEIPFDPSIAMCTESGIPFVDGSPDSPSCLAFKELSLSISNQTQ